MRVKDLNNTSTMEGYKYGAEYAAYLSSPRSPLALFARRCFLKAAAKSTIGRTIDFGCGVGELLELLERGSIGFDINKHCISICIAKGLQVYLYDPEEDGYELKMLSPEDGFRTMIMSHLLEHLDRPFEVLDQVLLSCQRLNIVRFVMVVPDLKGFQSDPTHRTFISEETLPETIGAFTLTSVKHFPFKSHFFQNNFKNNELQAVYEREDNR